MSKSKASDAQTVSLSFLRSYEKILTLLSDKGRPELQSRQQPVPAFLKSVPGFRKLLGSICSVATAVPDANNEEWNPLSQRPHAPLPPAVHTDEFGAQVIALKEGIDAFTTLAHEIMHVALWEPFFTGKWLPSNRKQFQEFSLLAEGFCYFYTDIVVSGSVRIRFPDGEFALSRLSPGNAIFHPIRAFKSLAIDEPSAILDIYLEGFRGSQTLLWQPRDGNHFASYLARQAYDFYAGSLVYLNELYSALETFGCFSKFYDRFCRISGLPSLWHDHSTPNSNNLKAYFLSFYSDGLSKLTHTSDQVVERVRWRRMLQTRAYYSSQVLWILESNLMISSSLSSRDVNQMTSCLNRYLEKLEVGIHMLQGETLDGICDSIRQADHYYTKHVRDKLKMHHAWVGHRWFIAPKRAGGLVSIARSSRPRTKSLKTTLMPRDHLTHQFKAIDFIVEELTVGLRTCRSKIERAELLEQLARISKIGAAYAKSNREDRLKLYKQLQKELKHPRILEIWSIPLSAFDPRANQYRELLFSYQ